jgi:Rrf2 family protein
MIPMTAEYALRAMVVLARDAGNTRSADEIAAATRVPRRYVNKVLQALVRAHLVRSQPGPGGGYALRRAPDQVSLLDVVNAVEPMPRIRRCPLGLKGHTSLCLLHQQLDMAWASAERAFASVTIGELLSETKSAPPLCEPGEVKNARAATRSGMAVTKRKSRS